MILTLNYHLDLRFLMCYCFSMRWAQCWPNFSNRSLNKGFIDFIGYAAFCLSGFNGLTYEKMVVIFELSVPREICILILSKSLFELESEYEYDGYFMDMRQSPKSNDKSRTKYIPMINLERNTKIQSCIHAENGSLLRGRVNAAPLKFGESEGNHCIRLLTINQVLTKTLVPRAGPRGCLNTPPPC